MKKQLQIFLLAFIAITPVAAQRVARRVVAEHFTNSYCSVCASRNPGLFQTLAQFPQVLHLAIYPSAPYAACTLNQYNKPEQDARTNYYRVYGSTPRLIVQGREIPAGTSFTNPSIFTTETDSLSAFDVVITIRQVSANTGEAGLKIYKNDASNLDSLWLYGVLAQDTLDFTSNNGESHHYDVFKKSIWGVNAIRVPVPAVIGDSVSLSASFVIDPMWATNKISATAMLQRNDQRMEQAARSGRLLLSNPTSVATLSSNSQIQFYPNPATDRLFFTEPLSGTVTIYDLQGRLQQHSTLSQGNSVSVSALEEGFYFIKVTSAGNESTFRFLKRQ